MCSDKQNSSCGLSVYHVYKEGNCKHQLLCHLVLMLVRQFQSTVWCQICADPWWVTSSLHPTCIRVPQHSLYEKIWQALVIYDILQCCQRNTKPWPRAAHKNLVKCGHQVVGVDVMHWQRRDKRTDRHQTNVLPPFTTDADSGKTKRLCMTSVLQSDNEAVFLTSLSSAHTGRVHLILF